MASHVGIDDGDDGAFSQKKCKFLQPTKHLKHPSFMLFIGSSGSGKTIMALDVARRIHRATPFYYAIAIMGSDSMPVSTLKQFIPECGIFMVERDNAKTVVANIQATLGRLARQNAKRAERGLPKRPILILIDDVGMIDECMKAGFMRDLPSKGRHMEATTMLLIQYANQAIAETRDQANYVFLFRNDNKKKLKLAYDELFNSCFDSEKAFYENIRHSLVMRRAFVWSRYLSMGGEFPLFWYQVKDGSVMLDRPEKLANPAFFSLSKRYCRDTASDALKWQV